MPYENRLDPACDPTTCRTQPTLVFGAVSEIRGPIKCSKERPNLVERIQYYSRRTLGTSRRGEWVLGLDGEGVGVEREKQKIFASQKFHRKVPKMAVPQ